MRGSLGLSAGRALRTNSKGLKGFQLEVGAWRSPRILVYRIIFCRSSFSNFVLEEDGSERSHISSLFYFIWFIFLYFLFPCFHILNFVVKEYGAERDHISSLYQTRPQFLPISGLPSSQNFHPHFDQDLTWFSLQTPFWFKTLPKLMPVFFDNGEKDPSRAWLEFGPIQNRKYALNNFLYLYFLEQQLYVSKSKY